eukprot:jgi/Mesvir1/27810/Mv07491-RA.1
MSTIQSNKDISEDALWPPLTLFHEGNRSLQGLTPSLDDQSSRRDLPPQLPDQPSSLHEQSPILQGVPPALEKLLPCLQDPELLNIQGMTPSLQDQPSLQDLSSSLQDQAPTLQDLLCMRGVGSLLVSPLPLLDKLRLRASCRAFAQAVDECLGCLTHLDGKDLGYGIKGTHHVAATAWLAAKCPSLKNFTVCPCRGWVGSVSGPWTVCAWSTPAANTGVEMLASRCALLVSMDLRGATGVDDRGLTAVGRTCPLLEELYSAGPVTNAGIIAIGEGCPCLTVLDLSFSGHVDDDALTVVAERCTGLRHLAVRDTQVTERGVSAVLRQCPGLVLLDLCSCEQVRGLMSPGTDRREAAAGWAIAPGTESSETRDNAVVGGRQLAGLMVSGVPGGRQLALRVLNLNYCENIPPAAFLELAPRCPHLERLEVTTCEGVTDASIVAFASHCPQLCYLDTSYNGAVTDAGIEAVAFHCPKLRHLDVTDCPEVTDASIMLVGKRCGRLEHFSATHSGVGWDGLRAVVEGCSGIKHLRPAYP